MSASRGVSRRIKRYWVVYALMLPALIAIALFSYLPMAGIYMAFTNYKLGRGFQAVFSGQFIGLTHFSRLFSNVMFTRTLINTIVINLLKLLFSFPAPIIFAVLVNEVRTRRYKRVIQTVSYLPSFLSSVVIYGLLMGLLSPSYGLINSLLNALGKETIHFLGVPRYFRTILVSIDVWRYTGWEAIIYLAAITSIDQEQYEAATIDGATRVQQVFFVTLPSLRDLIILMFILRVGTIMSSDFEMIFQLLSPPLYSVGDVIDTFVYRIGLIKAEFSFSTAVGVFKSLVGLALILITNRLAKHFGSTGIW